MIPLVAGGARRRAEESNQSPQRPVKGAAGLTPKTPSASPSAGRDGRRPRRTVGGHERVRSRQRHVGLRDAIRVWDISALSGETLKALTEASARVIRVARLWLGRARDVGEMRIYQ